jgi:hypothetical protein
VSINDNSPDQEISLQSIDFTPPVDMKIGDLASGGARLERRADEEITQHERRV